MQEPYGIVRKQNVLNELRSTNLTLQELRFFSIYLARIDFQNRDTKYVRFPLSEFKKIMEFGRLNINQLKESTDRLLGKKVHIPLDDGGFRSIVLFDQCEVNKDSSGEWYVEISASVPAMPLMFDFKERYFTYKLWNALRLKSANQIRMYEILKQYEKIGQREISVSDLRELLGVAPNEYPRWNNFKVRVLDSCQQALRDTTDICFDYRRGKIGNGGKWLTVIFSIYPNTPKDKEMIIFGEELELHLHPQTAKAIETEISQDLQQMICFAGDLTPNEVKEIYYAMQEKVYADIFISFKRLYQTAVNNDPADLKKYVLGIIKNDVVSKPTETTETTDPDIEKYKVLINRF